MNTVTLYAETKLPTKLGDMRLRVYRDQVGSEPFALIAGHLKTYQQHLAHLEKPHTGSAATTSSA